MIISILGKQASGKGTQAELIENEFNFLRVEMGQILKEAAKTDEKINEMVNVKGELVPAEIAFKNAKEFIEKNNTNKKDILFDGYPRSIEQYRLLNEWLVKKRLKLDLVIWLEISDEEAIKRISARRVCSKCGEVYNLNTNPPENEGVCDKCGGGLIQREDDKPEAVRKRLGWSKDITGKLLEIFEEEGKLFRVDGERPIDVIFVNIKQVITDITEESTEDTEVNE